MKFDFNFKNAIFLSLIIIALWSLSEDFIFIIHAFISLKVNDVLGIIVLLFLLLSLTIVIIWWFSKKGNKKELFLSKSDIWFLLPFILLTVASLCFRTAIEELLGIVAKIKLLDENTGEDIIVNFRRLVFIINGILFAPIMEEILFRGLLQKQIAKKTAPPDSDFNFILIICFDSFKYKKNSIYFYKWIYLGICLS